MINDDIETIESGYEFLLAYAAQGRPADMEATGPGPHARPTLQGMQQAMQNLVSEFSGSADNFEQLIADDCNKAGAALGFILAQKNIGSEMVDNLNASIHLRAVLTDLFLYGEAKEPSGDVKEQPLWEEAKR
ncbi:MAG: hypothetical protein R3F41_11205 [Gammaproteobacteria bacterium]|nr:hypothetical protein [Pseudomonadales bacterium]MCP5348177.1 hypothetical protein [Pseudomonadales bacterium]